MEQINAIELADEEVYPDDSVLKAVLRRAYPAYCALMELFAANGLDHEWRYYRDGKAWLCKVQYKKKTVAWMSAWRGFMKATVYFPERSAAALDGLDIAEELKVSMRNARSVGASRPCVFEIRSKKALRDLAIVMKRKMALK